MFRMNLKFLLEPEVPDEPLDPEVPDEPDEPDVPDDFLKFPMNRMSS